MWQTVTRRRLMVPLSARILGGCSLSLDTGSAHNLCAYSTQKSSESHSAGFQEPWAAEEPLSGYDPAVSGYLPIAIGDFLGFRYKAVRKIGWGVYSNVWIAEDTRLVSTLQYQRHFLLIRLVHLAQPQASLPYTPP